LCAGGDVVAVYHSVRKDGVEARRFWRDEYLMNGQVGRFAKPFVSLMDGIVMGGGVGVSAHANTRVVTDTSKIAMPEVGIGFLPDVGGAFLLSRAPGALGLYAALTGAPFSGDDAIAMGFADHYVPHSDLDAFTAAIIADGVESALVSHAVEPPASALAAQRDWIDECFSADTVEDIVARLRAFREDGSGPDAGPAQDAANLIATRSPIAVSVALEVVRRAAKLETLEDVLIQDYRVSSASARSHDLVEGIRAQIIDKDRNPKWSPATLAEVTAADIDAYFAPVDDDLTF
jgi:enoyl-CoA hydratase